MTPWESLHRPRAEPDPGRVTTPAEARAEREAATAVSPEVQAGRVLIESAIREARRPIRIAVPLLTKRAQDYLRPKYEAAGWSWVYDCDPRDGDYIEINEGKPCR